MRPESDPLISADRIQARVRELAAQLSSDYAGQAPVVLIVLKGSVYFGADLARSMSSSVVVEFIRAESYSGDVSSGNVRFATLPREPLAGRPVLIVEDVLDSGRTAVRLVEWVRSQRPDSVKLATLLDKPDARQTPIEADYIGFTIPNEFVVGYGLDYNQQFRELPAIHRLKHDQ